MAAILVLLSLLGGIAAASREARNARRERERADRRLKEVRQLTNSFLFEFHNAIANLAGSTPARELPVRRALEYLGMLAREVGNDPSLQRELAEAYEKLGEIQGGSGANLGDTAGAIASFRSALAIREALLAADPESATDAAALAACLETLAGTLGRAGSADESFRLARRALAVRERLVKSDPKSRRALALTHKYLSTARFRLGEAELALQGYRRSEAIERDLVAADPKNAGIREALARGYLHPGRQHAR